MFKSNNVKIFTIIIIVFFIMSCNFFREEQIYHSPTQKYVFNPNIKNNLEILFTPKDIDTEEFTPVKVTSLWQQEQYLNLLYAFLESQFEDDGLEWKINSIVFDTKCLTMDSGFNHAMFRVSKQIKEEGVDVRQVIDININIIDNTIFSHQKKYKPRYLTWKNIPLEDYQFSAEDIVTIADQYGGEISRNKINNECSIEIWQIPDSPKYNGWSISYWYQNPATGIDELVFEKNIDPKTGEILETTK